MQEKELKKQKQKEKKKNNASKILSFCPNALLSLVYIAKV